MKRLIALFVLFLSCAVAGAAETSFTSTLAPGERTAAGLDGLTPAQVEQLNAFVERYKSAEVTREIVKAVKEVHEREAGFESRNADTRIETRLIGTCSGWEKNTHFRLENGQVWRVANSDSYYYPKKLTNPAVVIQTAAISGFWLTIGDLPRVRVKRVK